MAEFAVPVTKMGLDRIKEIAREHGVDVDHEETPKERDQRRERDEKAMQEAFRRQKAKIYFNYSLWSSDKPLKFTFSQWNKNLQPNSQLAKVLCRQAYELAESMVNEPQNVIMWGKPGVGKTSLALAMLNYLEAHGKSVMVVSTAELSNLYHLQYEARDVPQRIADIIRAMKEVDVLVLDDFGTEGGLASRIMESGYKGVHSDLQRGIYQVANARFDLNTNRRLGSTIITTNNTVKELQRMYDGKILSRLLPLAHDQQHQLNFNGLEDVRGRG